MSKLICKCCSSSADFKEIGLVSIEGISYKVFECGCGTKSYIPIK